MFRCQALAPALLVGCIWYSPGAWGQSLSFTVAPVFPAGSLPTSVAAGDLNGDGKPDLAVTNQNGVAILLNDGRGGFQPLVSYATGTNPQSVATADFNGDGKRDLAVVNQGSGTVSVLLGNGNGTFQSAVSYTAGSNPRSVVIADINSDGKADLAIVDSGFAAGSGVSVLMGNGDGTFRAATFVAAGSVSLSVAVGDFNGDGKADFAVANEGSDNVSVLLGNGDGTFHTPVNYSMDQPGLSVSPTSVVAGDFNLDGKVDLAVATPSRKDIAVLLGLGNGSFQAPIHYGLDDPNFVNGNNMLVAADLNNDGRLDLVLANLSSNHVTVLPGTGDGTFPASKSYAAGPEPVGVAVADFNGDGRLDLAVADKGIPGEVALLLGNGDGTLQAALLYRSASIPDSLVAGDLNGDGKVDVVAASRLSPAASGIGSGVALLGNGNGSFQPPDIWATSSATSVALGDFNGDGKLDLVETNPAPGNGNVAILLGKGDGTFGSPVSYIAGTVPQAVAVADLNGDGKADIVVGNHGSANVSVLLGLGNGTFQGAVNYATPNSGTPDSVAVADFNGDGKPDLAVAISGTNATLVAILLGNGNGTFQAEVSHAAGFHSSSPLSIVAADFNGDGRPDLAVTDGTTLAVLMGNGNGAFQTPVTYLLVSSGKAINGMVVVGDFNGDTKPDLAATSRDGVSVLLGNGDGTFQGPVTFTPSLGGALTVGDLDGDGRPDLVVADSSQDATTTDTVAILLNTSVVPVPVTVDTSPSGLLAVIGGGAPCTTPCKVILNWGTLHSIDVFAAPPASAPGTRYRFVSWSDGGGISHQIRVPAKPITYTAFYKTQYFLTTAASPPAGGTITYPSPEVFDLGGFIYAGTVVPINAVSNSGYKFAGWTGNVADASSPSTTVTMSGPQAVTAKFTPGSCVSSCAPAITPNAIGNAASNAQLVAAGGLFSIFGTNLANAVSQADRIPLPTVLGGVSVTVNGIPAPLLYVSQIQVNAQVPWSVRAGTATVIVTNNGASSSPAVVQAAAGSPGIFTVQFGVGQAIAVNGDGTIAAAVGSIPGLTTHPANRGDTIVIYATGLGAVSPAAVDGKASTDQLRKTVVTPDVQVGGVSGVVQFSGLSPQFVGVNQLNVVLAFSTPTGDKVPLQVQMGGITTTNQVTLAVH